MSIVLYGKTHKNQMELNVVSTHPDPNWMKVCVTRWNLTTYPLIGNSQKMIEDNQTLKDTPEVSELHNMKPIDAMTEEQLIEYLIMKDIPQHIWRDYEKSNKPRLVICTRSQIPQKRVWRNAWKIKEDININNEEKVGVGEK